MFGRFFSKTPKYTVEALPSGRFAIVDTRNGIFKTYARKRDAIRGADRAGIVLAG